LQVGGSVTLTLQAENVTDLFNAPIKLGFDPKVVRLTSIQPGTLMSGDGKKINFTENTANDTGEATINISRTPGTGGVTGSGTLVTLTFQAVGRGTAAVTVNDASLRNTRLQPVTAGTPTTNIVVQ